MIEIISILFLWAFKQAAKLLIMLFFAAVIEINMERGNKNDKTSLFGRLADILYIFMIIFTCEYLLQHFFGGQKVDHTAEETVKLQASVN